MISVKHDDLGAVGEALSHGPSRSEAYKLLRTLLGYTHQQANEALGPDEPATEVDSQR